MKNKDPQTLSILAFIVLVLLCLCIIGTPFFAIYYLNRNSQARQDESTWTLIGTKTIQVERVFYHEENDYSFFVRENNALTTTKFNVNNGYCDRTYQIFDDVSANEPMYVKILTYKTTQDDKIHKIEIHIHSIKEIDGGEWKKPKNRSGQTTIVG